MSSTHVLIPGLCFLLGACSSTPEPVARVSVPAPAAASVQAPSPTNVAEPADNTAKESARAAELAVKVANGTASAAEKAELDNFIRGRK